jgi:flagellar protein FliO/FliZ
METAIVALRVALSLGVVLGLLWFLHRRITRGSKLRGPAASITVLGKQAVGQKASVVVVDADGKRFILGVTEHTITVLHGQDSPATATATATAFAEVLGASTPGGAAHDSETHDSPRTLPVAASTADPLAEGLLTPGARVPGMLGGSILSPATWRQAAAALGRGR